MTMRECYVWSAVVESSERTENFKSFLLDGNEDVGSCAVVAHFRTLRDALAEKRFSHSQFKFSHAQN